MIEIDVLLRSVFIIDQNRGVPLSGPVGKMDPRTTAELEKKWDDGTDETVLTEPGNAGLAIERVQIGLRE